MTPDSGRNSGITGLLDIQNAPTIAVKVYEWKDSTNIANVENTGYGDAGQSSSRGENENGGFVFEGVLQRQLWPVPQVPANAIGTLTVMYDYGNTAKKSQTVRLTSFVLDKDQKDQNNWTFTIHCVRQGAVTWSTGANGWQGSQPNPAAPTPGTKTVYSGASKTADSNKLVDSSQRVIDFWGINADTDAGEVAQIAASIAAYATAPQTWEKLYSSTLTRTGSSGGRIVQMWRTTDSKDDVQMPRSPRLIDPYSLTDYANSATVLSGSMPAYLSSLRDRGKEYVQLNDHRFVEVEKLGVRSTKDDEEMPRSPNNVDPNWIGNAAASAVVSAGTIPAPSSALYLRGTEYIQLTPGQYVAVQKLGTRSTVHDVTIPATNSWRSAQTAYRDAVATLISNTGTDAAVADSLWSAFQSVANAYGLTVRSIDPKTKVVVYEYVNPGIQVSGFTGGGGRYVDARVSGGNVQVYVTRNDDYANGQRRVRLGRPWIIDKPIRRFVISRLLTGTTIPEQVSLIGQSNNASFLGLAAGTVLYEGPTYQTNIALSGTLPFGMGYSFFSDANGLFTNVPQDFFLYDQYLTTADTTVNGWVNASTIGVSGISTPTQGNFAVFVT